jgi:hypothetical protein
MTENAIAITPFSNLKLAIVILGVSLVATLAVTAVRKRSWALSALTASIVLAAAVSVFYVRVERVRPPQAWPSPISVTQPLQRTSHPLVIVEPTRGGGASIEVPPDEETWARDGNVLGFLPPCRWLEEAVAARKRDVIGDTVFVYQDTPEDRVFGFSDKEGSANIAFRAARQSAERRLAVLGLVALKKADRGFNAVSAQPLALQKASGFFQKMEEHLEKATLPYSGNETFRASVVARAGREEVNGLATAIRDEIARGWVKRQRDAETWLLATAAVLVLGFAVFLVYTFANAGTKGYFAWPLRIASFAIFFLLCVGLIYLRRRLGGG